MPGSLNDILPEPVSPESEAILLDLLKRKVMASARLTVDLLHAMEARFGPEARDPEADLHDFCDQLDRATVIARVQRNHAKRIVAFLVATITERDLADAVADANSVARLGMTRNRRRGAHRTAPIAIRTDELLGSVHEHQPDSDGGVGRAVNSDVVGAEIAL